MNNHAFDGGQSTPEEKELRDFYKRLLNFAINSDALMGAYEEIHTYNRENTENYNQKVFSFVRWSDDEKLIIISNFDDTEGYQFDLKLPISVVESWRLKDGTYQFVEQIYEKHSSKLVVENGVGVIKIKLSPLESLILKLEN